jgi:hypothetical protein
VRPDGRLALRLETRWRNGTTHLLMERHELLERPVPEVTFASRDRLGACSSARLDGDCARVSLGALG